MRLYLSKKEADVLKELLLYERYNPNPVYQGIAALLVERINLCRALKQNEMKSKEAVK